MTYEVHGVEQGYIKGFATQKEAQQFIRYLKRADKTENIQDTYYVVCVNE